MTGRSRGGWLIVTLIALSASLPFLDKAFHIDDVLYLHVARQILKTPWDPYGHSTGTQILWDAIDGKPATLYATDYNPPLWKYALAGVILVGGEVEWKLHLLSSAALVAAAWGLYRLSSRITDRPVWCVMMIILSPFLMPAQNLMLEVPLLAFVVWALEREWSSWQTGKVGPALVAGVFVGLAILTKYTAGLLLPILVIGCALQRRWISLAFLGPAITLLAGWCLHNLAMYGELHLTSHGTVFKPDEWHYRLLTVLRIVGGVSVFGPIWWLALWRRGWVGCLALAGIAGVGIALGCADLVQVLAWYEKIKTAVPHQLNGFFVIFTALGFATLASIAVESSLSLARDSSAWRRDADARFLEVILLGLVVFNVVSVPFNAVRHLLLAFLAMAWLTARTAGSMRANGLAWVLMIASTLLGASLAVGDYDYAAGYRTFAKTVIRQARQEVERRVWFTGTWGFKYYAEREGAQAYYPGIQRTDQGQPIAGDIVFHSQMLNWAPVMRTVPNAFLESYVPLEGRWPMRPVVPGACYYGVSRHLLPWGFYLPEVVDPSSGSFTVVPLDVIAVWGVHSQTAP